MLIFVVRRLVQMAVLLAILSVVIFALLAMMPGDPIDMLVGSSAGMKPEDKARLRAIYGLDQPIPIRYAKWVRKVVWERDLGTSRTYNKPVSELIGARVGNTIKLMGSAMLLAFSLAVPLGVYAAVRQYTRFDYVMMLVMFVGISIPSFWFGMVAIIVFSLWLGLLPAGGIPPEGGGLMATIRYIAMPVIVLSYEFLGGWSRYVRTSMLEVMTQDYIRTARAKGLDETSVVMRHGLRNGLIPVVTVIAISIPNLFGGAVITETVFAWPGMGRLLYDSVINSDYYVALVAFMILATLTLTFSILSDLAYAYLDPRVRLG